MKKILLLPVLLALLSGCSQTQFNDMTSSLSDTLGSLVSVDSNSQTKGSKSDGTTVTGTTKQTSETKGSFTLTVNTDVDTVFAAMSDEFRFPSPQRLRQIAGDDADYYMMDGSYHYELNPGAMYYLGYNRLAHNNNALNLTMRLLKSGKGTKITGNYIYHGPSSNVKNEIIARIKKAL